ncbi:transketolase family protein [Thermodesulfobacteriota bacterium]
MRKAFSDMLVNVAKENPRIIFLTGDLGFQVFDEFIVQFPTRYVNVGVAEAQLINTAVGLALEGWRPIAYSIGSFVTARPFEQIRFGIAYHNLPVMVVGAGGGFTYAQAGVTHHAADDLVLMGALPNMSIVTPGGPDELRELMPQMLKLKGPSYLRVGKFGESEVGHDSSISLGKARKLIDGEKVAVLTSGDIVSDIYPKMRELEGSKINPALYHFHTVKPVDRECFAEIADRYAIAIITEESIPQGGLYHEICAWKSETNSHLKIVRRGPPEAFILGNPGREELRRRIGIDGDSLKSFLLQMSTRSDFEP